MIQQFTKTLIADNTGVRKVLCIRILGNNKSIGNIGSVIISVIKKVEPNKLLKKAQLIKALILRSQKNVKRADGSYIHFSENAAIVLTNDHKPKGSRIFGPILTELKNTPFINVYALATDLV